MSASRHVLPVSVALSVWLNLSACSLMLDPSVCEVDSDCGGGVCQLGVCVGPRVDVGGEAGVTGGEAGVTGGEAGVIGGEAGVIGGEAGVIGGEAGVTGGEAGIIGGEAGITGGEAGVEVGPEDFSCRFLTERSTAGERQRLYNNSLYTGEGELTLYVEAFAPEGWRDQIQLLLDGAPQPLSPEAEEGVYSATLTLSAEGDHRARLLIGVESDVRCAEPLDLTLDTTPPSLDVLNPATREAWVSAQEGSPSAQVELSLRDESPVSVLRGAELLASDLTALSFTHEVALVEGENRISFSATDLVGNQSEAVEVVFYYDPTPPYLVISTPQGPRVSTEERALTLSGVVYAQETAGGGSGIERGARLELTQRSPNPTTGAEQLTRQLATTDERGLFSLNLTLAEGANALELCAYDGARNSDCESLTVTYTPALPCVTLTSAPLTSSASYELTGALCPSVSRVEVSVSGGAPQEATITGVGEGRTMSFPVTFSAHAEVLSFEVSAYSAEGRVVSEQLSVTFDETPPVVSLITPTQGACTNAQSLNVCARVDDPESEVTRVTLNGQLIDLTASEGQPAGWWRDFCVAKPLSSGAQTFTISATNGAGAQSSDQAQVTVDRIAPNVSFGQAEGAWYGASSRGVVTVQGVVSSADCPLSPQGFKVYTLGLNASNELVRVSAGRTPTLSAEGAFTYLETFSEGDQAVEVELTDTAGNTRSRTHTFKVDRTGPDLYLNEPESEQVVGRSPTLNVSLQLEDLGSGVSRVTANAQPLTLSALPNSQPPAWVASGELSFAEGLHYITLRAEDAVGNLSELLITYRRDVTPPVVLLASPVEGEGVHTPEVALVSASDASSGVSSVLVNGVPASREGELWVAPSAPLNPLTPSLEVEAIDEAGNSATLNVGLSLPAYALRPAERSGLPAEGLGLSHYVGLWWGEWLAETPASLLAFSALTPSAQVGGASAALRAAAGVSDQGAFSASSSVGGGLTGRYTLTPQGALPHAELLRGAQLAWLGSRLTLVTLREDPTQGVVPLVEGYAQVGALLNEGVAVDPDLNLEALIGVTLGVGALSADVLHLADLSGDGLSDLIALHQNSVDVPPRLFTQNSERAFQFQLNGLGSRGLSDLHAPERRVGQPALGRLWSLDVNHDGRLDLLQQATLSQPTKLWLAQSNGAFVRDTGFPTASIDGVVQLDLDSTGDSGSPRLELIAFTLAGELLRYELNALGAWSSATLATLPQGVSGLERLDVNGDGQQSLLTYGAAGVQAWALQNGALVEVYDDLLPTLSPVDQLLVTDLDGDGDEDLLMSSGEALWVASANASVAHERPHVVSLSFEGASGQRAVEGAQVLIDEDNDFSFERVVLARPSGSTAIVIDGEASAVNLQVIFPDHGNVGDNQEARVVQSSASLLITDPQ